MPKDLRRYLEVRDETCRFPGCNRGAAHSDIDHALDWQFDGLTAHDNLAHLCPGEHGLKSETRWSYDIRPDGTLYWTSPTGRHFISEPATIIQPQPSPKAEHDGRAPERKPVLPDESDEPPPF
ncbi:HNH endonuclease [Cryobacterium sp. TMT1-21]|uniref:HNH endonuclease n=1 Tax=Cryobacterium shii TaxID=1259235 RepID=A0AAQ2C960_9MICO|nr:HNH endonuclease [Cryobacterium shii]TFD10118.1 HNH endonuclease [Cryobacterium sp. TMT1-21]